MKRIILIFLSLLLCFAALTSCDGRKTDENESASESESESANESGSGTNTDSGEARGFDYLNSNLSQYMTFDRSLYEEITVTISNEYLIGAEQVNDYIKDALFKNKALVSDTPVTDKAIEYGDSAFIYFTGYYNGEAFANGSNADDSEPMELSIGSGMFINGFEEGLIGVVPSQTSRENPIDLNLRFPDDYGNDMSGKEVVFKVWVEYLIEYTVPEYNEAFITEVEKFTADGEDLVKEYEEHIMELLENEVSSYREQEIENAMWSYLLEQTEVKAYPEGEVEYYYQSYMDQYEYYMQMYSYFGYSFADLGDFVVQYLGLSQGADWEAVIREESEFCVKQNLIFFTVAKLENMTLTEDEYNEAVNFYIDYYQQNSGATYTAEEIENMVGINYIEEYAIFNKVSELLRSNTVFVYAE